MFQIIAALFLSTVAIQAQAQVVNRDWKFIEEMDPLLQTQVCRAFTSASTSTVPVEISLNFPKARDKAPVILLKAAGSESAVLQLSSREVEELIPLQADVLYHVPTKFKKLVDVIEAANFLPLILTQNGQPLPLARISLAGSSATLRAVATCLGVREVVPVDFFTALTAKIDEIGNPVAGQTGVQLLEYVQQAFTFYGELTKADAALATLREQMRPLVRRETEALRVLAAAQAPLDRALAAQRQTEDQIAVAEARLAAIPGEIQTLTVQKGEAEKVLADKLAVFEPLRVRAAELERDVRGARNDVNSYSSAITERRDLISANENEVNNLEEEFRRLSIRQRSIEDEISTLERQRNSLRSDLATYNVDFEKRKILSQDFRYQQLQNSLRDLERRRDDARRDLERSENQLRRAEQELRNCQGTAGRDCANEQNKANRARGEVNQARGQLQGAEAQLNATQNQIGQIENEAERRAISGREELAGQLRQVDSKIGDLETERDRADRRKRDIESSLIPGLESEISRARTEIPGLERSLSRAQRELNDARAALAAYKQSVDFDRIEAEYEAAKDAVETLGKGITDRETEQRRLNRKLPELRSELAANEREVVRRTVARDREQVKVTDIQDQLKPQRAQEAVLAGNSTTWGAQFAEARKLFQALAARLAPLIQD